MEKYSEPWEDTQEFFNAVVARQNLENVRIKLLRDDKQKKSVYKIIKSNDLLKYETKVDVYVFVNEIIFEGLTDELKYLATEEILSGVLLSDKGTLTVKTGDINTYSGLLRKHSYEEYEVLQESVKTLFEVQKQLAD